MLRLRPYTPSDASTILSWTKNKTAFYQWTAGVLGEYPITEEQFNIVSNLMAFTAIDDNDTVGFFTMRRPNESFDELRFGFVIIDPDRRGQGYGKKMLQLAGFQDVLLDEVEKYTVLGEEWRCLELEIQL